MKVLTFITLLLFSMADGHWQTDFAKAKAEAAQANKLILVNFSGSDWCGPCIKLKRDILNSEGFQQYAAEYLVLVQADFPRLKKNQLSAQQTEHNEKLADKYNSQGKFPFTVLLDANGKKLKEWDGYPSGITVEGFIREVEAFK